MYRKLIILTSALAACAYVFPADAAGKKGITTGGPQKICFDDGSVANYKPGGSYEYTGRQGTYTGKWKYVGNHQYLINFDNGNSRVDTYDDAGGGQVIDHNPSGQTFNGHAC